MKHLIPLGICLTLFIGGLIHDTHASMYWDFETPDLETLGEPEATPQDSRPVLQPARQAAPKMYDDYELPEIEPLSAAEPPRTAPLSSAVEDSVSAPVARPQTLRRTQQSAPRDTSIQTVAPKPAVTQPGSQSGATPTVQPSQASPAGRDAGAAPTQTETKQPVTKKMKWGKTESGSN